MKRDGVNYKLMMKELEDKIHESSENNKRRYKELKKFRDNLVKLALQVYS